MRPQNLVFIFFGFSLLATSSQAAEFGCWDGTFGYNMASLAELGQRFELSLAGSQLGPLRFDLSDDVVVIDGWSSRKKIHVPFKKSECTFAPDGKSGRCEKSLERWAAPAAFVERYVQDLGRDNLNVISPVQASRVVMEFAIGSALRLEFHGARSLSDDERDTQSIEVDLQYCDRAREDVKFPQRVSDYLNQAH